MGSSAPCRRSLVATPLGFVVGLRAEARIASRFGHPVGIGGGTSAGAADVASRLAADGVKGLVSFGVAGALRSDLRPGSIIIPAIVLSAENRFAADRLMAQLFGGLTSHTLLAGSGVVADAASKRRLRLETGADAVDLESGAVAAVAVANRLPFVVVRSICDPAERHLPPAALAALDAAGGIGPLRVLRSLAGRPSQLPALVRLAADALLARRALAQLARRYQAEVRTSSR